MKCSVCGNDNGVNVNFCEGCGRRIPRCPTCGIELTCRDRFCSNDGTRLSDDLLLLVPEEAILQEPVWTKPAAPVAAPAGAWTGLIPDDYDEGTVKAGSEPAQAAGTPGTDPFGEETIRVTPVSGGRAWTGAPPVRNSDPVNIPAWDQAMPNPEPPQRAFCENCGKRIAVGNRFCTDCQRAAVRETGNSGKKKSKVILVLILVILLLLGLFAGGYAIVNSELFDWDSSSSNRSDREKDREDEDEDEEEDEDGDQPGDAVVNGGQELPDAVPSETSQGVVDPVDTQPATEDTTATGETETAVIETTAPTEVVTDPLLYWIENCDKKYLSEADLAGFDKQMCIYARNACYAKSGRMFNSTDLQQYFAQFDWYNPTISPDKFTASMLNSYQTANINLILEYERAHGYG